jgi:putative transposase
VVALDVTIIRMLDGSRAYLHGVLDNYSRKVLAWRVEPELSAASTRAILLEAREALVAGAKVNVLTDGGSENMIIAKDTDLVAVAEHVVAQVTVQFSNSMIEAFWKQLRHQWLYLHQLDSIAAVRRLVTEYIADHNTIIPREQLGGRTPDEAYARLALPIIASAHLEARRARVEANRAVRCRSCSPRSASEAAP